MVDGQKEFTMNSSNNSKHKLNNTKLKLKAVQLQFGQDITPQWPHHLLELIK